MRRIRTGLAAPVDELLEHALRILDAAGNAYGRAFDWSWGGGTVLTLRHRHRHSRDIDIFLPDAQYLPYLTPRLSEAAEPGVSDYEEAAEFVKLIYPQGEVDFIAGGTLSAPGVQPLVLGGRTIAVETDIEVVAKKLHYRAARFKPRDLFDLALILQKVPDAASTLEPWLTAAREALEAKLDSPSAAFAAAFDQIDAWTYRPTLRDCVAIVRAAIHRAG